MRWIKHYSNASDDEELAALIGEFGGDGYMFYWRILETISGQMKPENPQTSIEYTWKKWAEKCGLPVQKFKKISNFVETFSILFLKKSEKTLKIDCPKLLLIKDNHFKNLQVTGKKLAPKNKSNRIIEKETKEKDDDIPDWLEEIHFVCQEACGGWFPQCEDAVRKFGRDSVLEALAVAKNARKYKGGVVGWAYIEKVISGLPKGFKREAKRQSPGDIPPNDKFEYYD